MSYHDDPSVLAWGNTHPNAGANTRFLDPWWRHSGAGASDVKQIPLRQSGTLQKLVVRHNLAGGNGNSVVYTVMVNGAPTAITVTLATGAVGQAVDVVNSVAVAADSRVSLRATKAAAVGPGNLNVTATLEFV